jgi:hypothetical protein
MRSRYAFAMRFAGEGSSRWRVLQRAMVWTVLAITFAAAAGSANGQDAARHRLRLIMKDGSYQVVLGYQVAGDVVRYQSAERDGETEEVPLAQVDLPATERWQQQHAPAAERGPVLSPELAAEESARRAFRPEVAPNLRLPEGDSVLALDTVQGAPELVPLEQEGTDLNRETAHATEKQALNPSAEAHRILELKGPHAAVQLHAPSPVFYVRLGQDDADSGGAAFVVDTHGAGGRATPSGGDARSRDVLERLESRRDERVVNSIRIAWLGTDRRQPDVIECVQEALPGDHWLRLKAQEPLLPGEYALTEVLSDDSLNLNVWDFGIDPNAPESFEAIHPVVPKPPSLERRSEPPQ